MGLFGGCSNNGDSWIWILIIIVILLCFCDGGNNILGSNNSCDNDNQCC